MFVHGCLGAVGRSAVQIADVVPLSEAVHALTALERNQLGKRGKRVITPE